MEHDILKALESRRRFVGLSWENLSELLHRDASSLRKSFSERTGNPTLALLTDYAKVLDAEIVVASDEMRKEIADNDVSPLRAKISDQGEEIERLTHDLEFAQHMIQQLESEVAHLRRSVDYLKEDNQHKKALIDQDMVHRQQLATMADSLVAVLAKLK